MAIQHHGPLCPRSSRVPWSGQLPRKVWSSACRAGESDVPVSEVTPWPLSLPVSSGSFLEVPSLCYQVVLNSQQGLAGCTVFGCHGTGQGFQLAPELAGAEPTGDGQQQPFCDSQPGMIIPRWSHGCSCGEARLGVVPCGKVTGSHVHWALPVLWETFASCLLNGLLRKCKCSCPRIGPGTMYTNTPSLKFAFVVPRFFFLP